jgi:hypothetical protein
MPNNPEKLCDLIETRSASHGITRRRLWVLTSDAVLKGELELNFSAAVQPDPNNPEIARAAIARARWAIEHGGADPADWTWARRLVISPVAFDKWLKQALRNLQFPARPKRRAGAKKTLREKLKEFMEETYGGDPPEHITNKDIAIAARHRVGKIADERTVRRARGRK